MASYRPHSAAQLRRKIIWILSLAGIMLVGAIGYVGATGRLDYNMIVPVALGVSSATLLACGFVAYTFFSDRRRGT